MAKTLFGDEVVMAEITEFGDPVETEGFPPLPQITIDEERQTRRDTIVDDILFAPERTFEPLRQGQIATELLESLDEPADATRRSENRMMLAAVFGLPFEDVIIMEQSIMKELFEDDLISLKDRFQKNPVEGGFFKKLGESVRRGSKNVSSDIAVYEAAFENRGNINEVLRTRAKHQLEQTLSPIEGNLITNLFYKSGQIAPGMVRGYWSAMPEAFAGMVTGITLAAVAGQAGPQVALPEEALTVPVGAVIGLKIGLSTGSAFFWYKQGAGSFFAAMMDKNLDPEISRNVAGVAAIPYAIVELLQVKALTPGLRKGAEDIVRRTTLKVIAQATKTYGSTFTQEVVEEIAQEIIQISAEDLSEYLTKSGIEIDARFIQERANRVWTTAKESAQALLLLPLPGAVIDVSTGHRAIVNQQKVDAINAKRFEFEQALDSIIPESVRKEAGLQAAEPTEAPSEAPAAPKVGVKPEKGIAAPPKPAEVDLEGLTYKELQQQAKNLGIKANQKKEALITQITEAEPAEAVTETLAEVPKEKRIISKEAFEAARKRLSDPTILRAGLDPQQLIDAVTVGGYLIETGVRNFGAWSAQMVKSIGEHIRPHLQSIWQTVQTERGFEEELKPRPGELVTTVPGTNIMFDTVKGPKGKDVVEFFRSGKKVHEIAVTGAEEQKNLLEANQAILAAKGKPIKVVTEDEAITERLIIAGTEQKVKILRETIAELEKMQSENKAREGTTQFDEGLEAFVTKRIKMKKAEIEQILTETPPKPVSTKKLGLTRAEQELLTPAQQKELRLRQIEGQKIGFKAGEKANLERAKTETLKLLHRQEVTKNIREKARELVMEFVPPDIRGDFLFRVTSAKTPRDLRVITETIEKGIARFEKRDAIENLREAAKAINPKKMLPEFAKTAKAILDSVQIGKIRLDTMVRNSDLKDMAQQVLDSAREDSVAAFRAQQMLDELREKTTKTLAINQLTIESIEQITDTLIALRFQNELDTIAAKDENATEAIRRRDEIKKSIVEIPEVPESLGGKQIKKFKLFHDNMESVLDAVSGARSGTYDLWRKSKKAITEFVYDVLNKGVDKQILHSEKARNIFRKILVDNKVTQKDILNWATRPEDVSIVKKVFGFAPRPQVHKFMLENAKGKVVEFEFTTNELMSIFMDSRHSHNLAVLLKDGYNRLIQGKKQKIRGLTIEKTEEIIASLTEQQKRVARQVGSKLMDGFNKDAINNTSVKLEFFELAKVFMYWPARRSITRIVRGKKLSGTVKVVEGMGLLKERVGIGNPMKLTGFFETVYATNKNVAAYVGLAEPLREVKSVYNKEIIEELENIGRGKEVKLITDLLERFEGQSTLIGPLDTIIKRMLGGFAKAKLFLNIKIAPRQQISEFLISAYVDTKYMTEFRGVGTKELTEEISELSPQLKARFEQLQFDRDIGDAFIENELMNYLTGKTTLIDKTAIGMKFFDKNAIIDIYRAVKAEVIEKNPNININSEEGKTLLKDRFEWVVRHTQPMWHPKDRSLIGSDPRPLIRSMTMFMSQREQLVRMVNNGVVDYINSKKTTEDAVRIGRVLGTVALNLVAFTLYNFAWATLIHRKKRDIWDLGKFFLNDILSLPFFGKYIAKSFEITFNALAGRPIFKRSFDEGPIEGILGRILIEAIPNFALAGKHFITKERYQSGPNRGKDKWPIELFVAVDAVVDAVASLKGIPYYGAKDIVRSVKAQLPEE